MIVCSVFLVLSQLRNVPTVFSQAFFSSRQCKPVPGDANWPSDAQWTALNQSLSGKLLASAPPAFACYPNGQAVLPNASAACAAVSAGWGNSTFHADYPIGNDWPLWEKEACLPTDIYDGPGASCDVNQYPKYVLDAHGPEDVQAGVKFAADTGVRLVVKATGHDFLGRSTAPGALSIWTRNIKGLSYAPAIQPAQCASSSLAGQPGLTVAAGQQMRDVYALARQYNVTLVAGADDNVGIAGWLLGGGHSTISATYGLGVDNVMEMQVVTPAGELVTANECQNPDLFWAFRGGGGATFGVLTSVTLAAYPDAPFLLGSFAFNTTESETANNNNSHFFEMLEYTYNQLPALSDAGLGGYTIAGKVEPETPADPFNAAAPNASVPTLVHTRDPTPRQMSFVLTAGMLNGTEAALAPLVQPLVDRLHTYNGSLQGTSSWIPEARFSDYRNSIGAAGVGINTVLTSRLWDRAALTDPGFGDALRALTNPGMQGLMVSGPAVRARAGDAASAHPAWRKTYLHVIVATVADWRNAISLTDVRAHIRDEIDPALRARAPDSGAYVNENNPYAADWQQTFWGDNYARLLQIKRAVDPDDLFWCSVCVGSEGWAEEENGRLCRL